MHGPSDSNTKIIPEFDPLIPLTQEDIQQVPRYLWFLTKLVNNKFSLFIVKKVLFVVLVLMAAVMLLNAYGYRININLSPLKDPQKAQFKYTPTHWVDILNTGTLHIKSYPPQANIYLDNIYYGRAGTRILGEIITNIPVGLYELKLTHPGFFDYVRTVPVKHNIVLNITAFLVKKPVFEPLITPNSGQQIQFIGHYKDTTVILITNGETSSLPPTTQPSPTSNIPKTTGTPSPTQPATSKLVLIRPKPFGILDTLEYDINFSVTNAHNLGNNTLLATVVPTHTASNPTSTNLLTPQLSSPSTVTNASEDTPPQQKADYTLVITSNKEPLIIKTQLLDTPDTQILQIGDGVVLLSQGDTYTVSKLQAEQSSLGLNTYTLTPVLKFNKHYEFEVGDIEFSTISPPTLLGEKTYVLARATSKQPDTDFFPIHLVELINQNEQATPKLIQTYTLPVEITAVSQFNIVKTNIRGVPQALLLNSINNSSQALVVGKLLKDDPDFKITSKQVKKPTADPKLKQNNIHLWHLPNKTQLLLLPDGVYNKDSLMLLDNLLLYANSSRKLRFIRFNTVKNDILNPLINKTMCDISTNFMDFIYRVDLIINLNTHDPVKAPVLPKENTNNTAQNATLLNKSTHNSAQPPQNTLQPLQHTSTLSKCYWWEKEAEDIFHSNSPHTSTKDTSNNSPQETTVNQPLTKPEDTPIYTIVGTHLLEITPNKVSTAQVVVE